MGVIADTLRASLRELAQADARLYRGMAELTADAPQAPTLPATQADIAAAMDTTTTTDGLLADMDAFLAECAATDARVEALLAQPVVIRSISGRLAALQALAAENAAALDAIEAEQAAISAQLDALERDA